MNSNWFKHIHYMLKNKKICAVLVLLAASSISVMGQSVLWPPKALDNNAEQNDTTSTVFEGKSSKKCDIKNHLTIISDSKIDTLLNAYIDERAQKGTIEGYRVQIFTGKKDEAFRIKSQFISEYPEYNIYIKFFTPDFYVRVGDFRTKSEALELRQKIKGSYTDPFIVEDKIEFPKLEVNDL